MEVHAHTHPSAGPETRKKWTHYFWEFLMLFLAVFCGFLAEYQLEHTIEHQREKQYALRLYDDIRQDTIIIRGAIADNDFVTSRMDTFRVMVETNKIESVPAGSWYYYGRFGTRFFRTSLQDATMEQLKSSGGLRYFKNNDVVDAIARYDHACRDMQTLLSLQNLTYNEIVSARDRLFNSFYIDEVMKADISQQKVDSFKQKNFPLLSNRKEDFIQYANLCQLRAHNNKGLKNLEEVAYRKAVVLLEQLKKVYRLK